MAGSFPGLISLFPPRLAMTERPFSLAKPEKRADPRIAFTFVARTAHPPFGWATETRRCSLRTAHGFWL